MLDNLLFDVIYTQIAIAFDVMVESGVDFNYYFVGSGQGVLDAECIMEMLLC